MSKILILAEHKKGKLKKASLELLTACKGNDVVGLIFGAGAKSAADELASKGVKEVFWVNDSKFDHYHPDAYAAAAEKAINESKPQFVLASASSLGKDLIPKLAARFDGPIATDCVALSLEGGQVKARRPFFAGKALADVSMESAPVSFISVRPNALSAGSMEGSGQVKEFPVSFDFAGSAIQFEGSTAGSSDRPDLTEANIIVSGGRSLKAKENFKILFDLADTLGAAVGASRAAVDEGLASHDMQVGQTGKTVNPTVYMAFGISGAIQHLAGMRTSKVIVAINKDPNAPIFQKADYGVVGDLFTLAPLITTEFKKLLGK